MARLSLLNQFLLLSFAALLPASISTLNKAVPQSHRAAGVFLLLEGGKYTFNFTAARAACGSLNVTMATTSQIDRAVQRGLQTCKFGWTAEEVAVVPRLTPDKMCGQGKTGVVTWKANPDKKFGAFCFNASEETPHRSTASPQISTISTPLITETPTSTAAAPLLRSTTESLPSRGPRTTQVPLTSAFTLILPSTRSTGIPSTSTTLNTFSTHIPTSLSHRVTSEPAVVSSAFSTSAHAPNFSVSSASAMPSTVSPAKPSLGDVPTALIILGTVLLLLTAAGIVWYYKLNIFTFWPQGQQKDDIETEMWKHTDSEMDLQSQHEGEEEEEDRKYSSDITLCVNPDMRTRSFE
ncbi:lymphatic vessel endothelial hyaluronic receptor 1b isoform X1 [Acanthopagrus latus]|uniref:lymphatic vessel endothelial hyaluronic receptor 1b isoform X1 n=1 Tax=Acanthopagrus latus TaxID=8177 RepID=UPI00187CD158|nr:lymphatic vessel endothelial hyaluronic receptor 1b isoform X1 [Acanthopagrus latus]